MEMSAACLMTTSKFKYRTAEILQYRSQSNVDDLRSDPFWECVFKGEKPEQFSKKQQTQIPENEMKRNWIKKQRTHPKWIRFRNGKCDEKERKNGNLFIIFLCVFRHAHGQMYESPAPRRCMYEKRGSRTCVRKWLFGRKKARYKLRQFWATIKSYLKTLLPWRYSVHSQIAFTANVSHFFACKTKASQPTFSSRFPIYWPCSLSLCPELLFAIFCVSARNVCRTRAVLLPMNSFLL